MKKYIWIILIIIICIVTFIFLNKDNKNTTIKIGVSTILSGDFAALGENIVNAAKLTVEEINKSGGINGKKIELIIEDAGLDGKSGLSAAQKLINIDRVKYIIGGTSSNGTLSVAPLVNKEHIIYMTPVTGGSNVDNAGEYIFRTANSDLLAGRDIATAMNKLGYKKVGVIAEVTEYTIDLKKSFEKQTLSLGNEIVVSEEFQSGTTDFRTLISKIKFSKIEALLIVSQTGIGGANLIKQMREVKFNPTIFSDFTFVTNESAKNIVGNFEGVYFADPKYNQDNKKTEDFLSLYKEKYKKQSLIPFHAVSTYDNIMLLTSAIKEVGDNSEKVHDWLITKVKNYNGLMGTYSLDEKGNSDLGFDIKIIKDNKFIKVY